MKATEFHHPTETGVIRNGDNRTLLRSLPAGCVDLVYVDPPFNSGRDYYAGERNSGVGFRDTWSWDAAAKSAFDEVVGMATLYPRLSVVMAEFRTLLGGKGTLAYLSFMALRIAELHRVLGPAGSMYLHCDGSAGHYLNMLMDAAFGPDNYRSKIAWKRTGSHSSTKGFGRVHDTIFFYTASDRYTWNVQYECDGGATPAPVRPAESGRQLNFLGDPEGPALVPLGDLWLDIDRINGMARERKGSYPTQKPLALLERIIKASSDPGDVVLDCFIGGGTTLVAAQKLGRRWLGMDLNPEACRMSADRLGRECGLREGVDFRCEIPMGVAS